MIPYEYIKFIRTGGSTKEKGIYLPACNEGPKGQYQPERVATVAAVKAVAEVLPLSAIAIVKS